MMIDEDYCVLSNDLMKFHILSFCSDDILSTRNDKEMLSPQKSDCPQFLR